MASFRIDVTLRDEPDDVGAACAHVRSLEARRDETGGERVAWLRTLSQLDAADALDWRQLADAGGPSSLDAAAALRTGQVVVSLAAWRPWCGSRTSSNGRRGSAAPSCCSSPR